MVRPMTFEITEQRKGETPVLSVVGELDLGTVTALARQVDAKLEEKPAGLTLNLTDLTFSKRPPTRVYRVRRSSSAAARCNPHSFR